MTHPRKLVAALAALALLAPSAARAQGCVGAPVPDGYRTLQLQAGASTYDIGEDVDGTGIGAAYRANPRGPLAYSAEYAFNSVGESGAKLHTGGVALSFRPSLPIPFLAVCARAGAMAARLSDPPSGTRYDNYTFPVGVVVELPFPLGGGNGVVPYLAPQYLFSRTSGNVFGFDLDRSGNGFGMEVGAGVRVRRAVLTLGGSFSDLPPELATTAFPKQSLFVRAGVLF